MAAVRKRLATDEGLQKIADAIQNTEAVQQAKQEIQAEGATQVANVQAAAEEIAGKVEQIDQNTQGISELKGDLSNRFDREKIDADLISITNQGIDATTGIQKYMAWTSVSDYIRVYKGDKIFWDGLKTFTESNSAMLCLYDSEKIFSQSFAGTNYPEIGETTITTDGYVRFSTLTETLPKNGGSCSISVKSKDELYVESKFKKELRNPVSIRIASNMNTIGNNVAGNKIEYTFNVYREVACAELDDSVKAIHLVYAVGDNENICAVITDMDDNVIKVINGNNNKGAKIKIDNVEGSAKIYWTVIRNDKPCAVYEFVDSKILLFEGTKKELLFSDGEEAKYDMIDLEYAHSFTFNQTTTTSGDITFELCGGFSVGLWMKIPSYSAVRNTSKIIIDAYKDSTLINKVSIDANAFQLNEWVLIKIPFDYTVTQRYLNRVVISVITSHTEDFTVLVSPFALENHYEKPILVINADSFWGGSERCGFYDYMINNQIPFTVTGVYHEEDMVSDEMKSKIKKAYNDGLLDVGIYTNEQPITHPISISATSYLTVKDSMEYLIESKIQDGFNPVSLGAGQHYITPAIKKVIDISGFKCIRGGNSGTSVLIHTDNNKIVYMTGNKNSAMFSGGTGFYFMHGVSTDPSSEYMESIYCNWDTVKTYLDDALALRDAGEIEILNMKQYAELLAN